MRRFAASVISLFSALALPAAAQTLYGQTGRCQSLTLADRGASGQCEDTLYTARVALDQLAFVFVLEDGTHVAFAWTERSDEDQTGQAPGDRTLRRVGFVFRSEIEWLSANGVCIVGKAFNTDTTIACDAKTEKGSFAARFQTDAREPARKFFGEPAPPSIGQAK